MALAIWMPLTQDCENRGLNIDKPLNYNVQISSTTGKLSDKAAYFNGSNTYLKTDINLSEDMIFMCWVKFNANGAYHIIDCRDTGGNNGYQPLYGGPSYGGIQIYSNAGGQYVFPYTFQTGVWYHLAAWYHYSYAELFINGVSQGTHSGAYGRSTYRTQQMRIGTRCSGANWLNGYIQDVRVYDGSQNFTADDIKKIANGLILNYNMDSCYEMVDCIDSTGVQGVVLPYTPTSNDIISMKFAMTDTSVTSCLWCARGSTTSQNSLSAFYIANTGVRCDYGTSAAMVNIGSLAVDTIHTLTMDAFQWYLDGTLKTSMSSQGFRAGNQIRLFSSYVDGVNNGLGNYSKLKIYNFSVYDTDTTTGKNRLKMNLIPVIRTIDLVAGLYDTVSKVFYTSSNPLVGYHPVEYIENTSSGPWINTGVPINANLQAQMKVMNLAVTGGTILGNTQKGDSNDWRLFNYNSNIYFDNRSSRINGSSFAPNTIYEFEVGNFYVKNLSTQTNLLTGSAVGAYSFADAPVGINGYGGDSRNRWYWLKLFQDWNLLRDFIPCIRTTDKAAGMFDKVQDKFYGNAGSGSFTTVNLSKIYKIYDYSGNGNNASLRSNTDFSLTDDTNSGILALRNVSGNPSAIIDVNLNPSFITNGTICFWYKKDSTAMNYNNGNFLVATQNSSGSWLFATSGTSPFNNGCSFSTYYIDGVQGANTSITDTNWHHYAIVGVNLSSWSSFSMQAHGDTSWLWRGNISNFKMFANALTTDEILKEYDIDAKIYPDISIGCNGLIPQTELQISNSGSLKINHSIKGNVGISGTNSQLHIGNIYEKLEYIESDGNQYIDTNLSFLETYEIDIDFEYLNSSYSGWTCLYGLRGSSANSYFAFFINASSLYVSPNYAGFDPGTGSKTIISKNKRYNIKTVLGKFFLDGVYMPTMSTTNKYTVDTSVRFNLFAVDTVNGTENRNIQARIYHCRISSDERTRYDFVPARRKSDNVVGLYDCVEHKFYTNNGTGSFKAGPSLWNLCFPYTKALSDDNFTTVVDNGINKLSYDK